MYSFLHERHAVFSRTRSLAVAGAVTLAVTVPFAFTCADTDTFTDTCAHTVTDTHPVTDTHTVADASAGRYDRVVIMSVLHHLVGSTPRSYQRNAEQALRNSQSLLGDGGRL